MAALLVAIAAMAACGKYDPGDFSDAGEDDEDDDDTAGRGGTGGRSGTGGRAPVTAGQRAPAPTTVACGTGTCTSAPNPFAGLPIPGLPAPVACCLDEAARTCGIAPMQGARCEPPALPDQRCPGIDLGALGRLGGMGAMTPAEPMSGCCTADGQCGLDGALFGRGCVENGEAQMLLSGIPFIGGLVDVPAAQACDAAGDDAGVDDDEN